MSTNKRKGRGTSGPRPGRTTRANFDKSVLNEGVYANMRWTHTFTSLIGSVVQVQVKNSSVYEGVLRTFSPKMEVVLEMAHKCDEGKSYTPSKDRLIEKIIFKHTDVVTISALNVDLDYANRDNFTDTAISKFNGQVSAKELQPWEGDGHEGDELEGLESTMDNSSPNGWDAAEMFRTNADRFNVKSTYDSSLLDYTTPLEYKDSQEFRDREAKAQRLAQEIEQSEQYKAGIELENNDEDEKISAVVRPDGSSASPSSSSGKYVPPQMRKNTQQNRATRAAGPPLAQSPPVSVKHDLSPEEEKNRKNISANSDESRLGKPQTPVEMPAPEMTTAPVPSTTVKSRDASPAVVVSQVDAKPDPIVPSNPSPAGSPVDGKHTEMKKSPVSQKIENDQQLAELKAFSLKFKLNDKEKKEEEIKKEPMMEEKEREIDPKDDDENREDNALKETVRNSTLNPNAKEFVFNPKAPVFAPKQQPQIPTPPRPQTQSPVLPPPAVAPVGHAFHHPSYTPPYHHMMPAGTMVSMPQSHIPPAPPQQPPQRAKRAVISVNQQEFNPSAQAVNATGPPILAQPAPIHNQTPQYPVSYVTQMVGQHGAAGAHVAGHVGYPQHQVMQLQPGSARLMNPQNMPVGHSHPQGMNNPAAMQQQSGTTVLVPQMHGQVPPGHQPQQQGGPQPPPHHHPPTHYQPPHHQSRATPPQSQPSHPAPSPAHQPNAPPPPQSQHPHQGHPPSSTPTQVLYQHSQHMAQQYPPLQPSPHTPTSPQAVQPNMPYSYGHQMPNPGAQQMTFTHIPQTTVSFSTAQHSHTPQTHQPNMIMVTGPHHAGAPTAMQHGHQQMQPHPPIQGPPVHAERHRFPTVPGGPGGPIHQAGAHGPPMGHPQQAGMGAVNLAPSQHPPQMHHHPHHHHPQAFHSHPQMHTQNHPPVQAFQPNP